MSTCKTCGVEDTQFTTMGEFLTHCRQCKKGAQAPDQQTAAAVEVDPEQGNRSPWPLSLPVEVCPGELLLFPEGRQMFLKVTGRRAGDRFVVDGVEMI